MKILQIFNKYIYEGGEEKSVERIFQFLSGPHEVRQVYFNSDEWGDKPGLFSKISQALLMIKNPRSLRIVREEIDDFKPGYILVHNLFPVGSAALVNFLSKIKIPVVFYVHNFRPFSVNGYLWAKNRLRMEGLDLNFLPEIVDASWQDSRLKTAWYAMILWSLHLRGTWKRIDHWIAISNFMKETFVKAGIAENKISVVRHSWEVSIAPIERENFAMESPFVFFGRLSEQKGIRNLIEAWKIAVGKRPELKLVICGEGPLEGFVREASREIPSISYQGFVFGKEKEEILRGSRCLLAPSLWFEPLGLVVYEGYEFSLPVIASDSGGLSETVVDGETGFLVKRDSVDDLASAVVRLVGLADGGVKMGRKGREWLVKNATEEEWSRRISNVFKKI